MEKSMIQIVDEQDNLIGLKERKLVNYDKEYYRVSALWLRDSKNRILLAQRKLTKDKDPGKWGPAVAGTVEEGEAYESNMLKEIEEEIGLTGLALQVGPKQKVTEPRHYFCQWFLASADIPAKSIVIQEEEVEQVTWIDRIELRQEVKRTPLKFIPIFSIVLKLLEPGLY